jgi:DNA gyrase/topoisomerase IV subunit B
MLPDPGIFAVTAFDPRRLATHLREIAFLNPGLRVELVDLGARGAVREESFFARGIDDWVACLTRAGWYTLVEC